MSVRLIAIDMDNTLLRYDKTYDVERFERVVKALDEKGIVTAIASGNVVDKLREYISPKAREYVYLAADNGNYVVKNDEVLHKTEIPQASFEEFIDLVKDDPDYDVFLSTGENTYTVDWDKKHKDYVGIYYEEIIELNSFDEIPEGEKPVKIAVLSQKSLDENKDFIMTVRHDIPGISGVTSGGGWIDIYMSGGGKGLAVKHLQKKYNIPIEETMTFGDSLNDASMVVMAEYSIAMNNGDPDFKDLCAYEIGTNEEQAVIDVLERYLREESLEFLEDYRR